MKLLSSCRLLQWFSIASLLVQSVCFYANHNSFSYMLISRLIYNSRYFYYHGAVLAESV